MLSHVNLLSKFKLKAMMIAGAVLLLISFIVGKGQGKAFYASYLVSGFWWISILLGSLFLVMLHHLVNAKWSVVVRRYFEHLAFVIPFVGLVFIPVMYFGIEKLYKWADPAVVAVDHLIQKKVAYLNVGFFSVRMVIFVLVWSVLAFALRHYSMKHDESGSEEDAAKMRAFSAVGMLFFALTLTFAAFDWIMSLDPHWYSTIFGIYVFAGCVVSSIAYSILMLLFFKSKGLFTNIVSVEHFHDLGKFMFAFTAFWAYIGFCQFFLIWYANIPEETIWYAHRWVGSWKSVSLLLAVGHFVIPFIFLLPRATKRTPVGLILFSVWILIMHYVDVVWMIAPNFYHHGIHLGVWDVLTFIGFGAIVKGALFQNMSQSALYPLKDKILQDSIHLKNH